MRGRRLSLAGVALLAAFGLFAAQASGAFPGHNGHIVFTGDRGGAPNDEIYSMRSDGTHVVRLTTNDWLEQWPEYSPDGRRIAFNGSGVRNNGDIYVMSASGSGLQQLTDDWNTEMEPTFSPDGRTIAFETDHNAYPLYRVIWLMNADGSNQRALTPIPKVPGLTNQEYSPDGQHIVYTADPGDIHIMNADGTADRQFTFSRANDWWPAYSPNGQQIVFSSDRTSNWDIYVKDVAGGAAKLLTANPADDTTPAFSPDGQKIVFSRGGDIWVMNADGSNKHQLTSGPGFDAAPNWGPKPGH